MNVGTVGANTLPTGTQSEAVVNNGDLGKDDFLKLLVTQLRYQNPSDPMSNEAFIAQSAQFSALEQMKDMNEGVQALVELQKASSRTAALNLIGKNVVVEQWDISLLAGTPADMSYSLSADANVAVTIYNAGGDAVRTIDVGDQLGGNYTLTWDGLNDEGATLQDGQYTYDVFATDVDGNDVDASGMVSGVVDGLILGSEPQISIGGMRFPLTAVTEVTPDTPAD